MQAFHWSCKMQGNAWPERTANKQFARELKQRPLLPVLFAAFLHAQVQQGSGPEYGPLQKHVSNHIATEVQQCQLGAYPADVPEVPEKVMDLAQNKAPWRTPQLIFSISCLGRPDDTRKPSESQLCAFSRLGHQTAPGRCQEASR